MNYTLIEPQIAHNLTVLQRVFTNRGIPLLEVEHYLNTTNEDILNPTLLNNMETGARMLISHITNADDLLIQIDSDADGFTSAALLINYLYLHFPNYAKNHVHYRLHTGKEHGILLETISENIKLVIAPDSSSNDYLVHDELKARGVDVLVLDHHEVEIESKSACVINNQLDDYPTKSLSGVGIVYKFCSFLDFLLNSDSATQFLDLVALGLISDMMDLRDFETRHLIKLGLENIKNPFFSAMVEQQAYSLKNEVTPFGVSFYITPYINATIRMGSQYEKELLFDAMLDHKAYIKIPSTKRGCKGQMETIVEQACRNSTNIKNRQTKARDDNLEFIENIIKERNLLEHKILIIPIEKVSIEKNLTGLLANQLMGKYQCPVIILNKTMDEDKKIVWSGSARSCEALPNFKDFLQSTRRFSMLAGHQAAFGCSIRDSQLTPFITYSDQLLKNYDFNPNYRVDFIYTSYNINPNEILDLANLNWVWGKGVEQPLIAIENIVVKSDNIQLMSPDRNPTLKITLPNGLQLLKFRSSKEEFDSLHSDGYTTINVVGKCERNEWNGNITPQILIESYEVIGKTDYYF